MRILEFKPNICADDVELDDDELQALLRRVLAKTIETNLTAIIEELEIYFDYDKEDCGITISHRDFSLFAFVSMEEIFSHCMHTGRKEDTPEEDDGEYLRLLENISAKLQSEINDIKGANNG